MYEAFGISAKVEELANKVESKIEPIFKQIGSLHKKRLPEGSLLCLFDGIKLPYRL